jgi:hypothetical protein
MMAFFFRPADPSMSIKILTPNCSAISVLPSSGYERHERNWRLPNATVTMPVIETGGQAHHANQIYTRSG